MGVGGGVQLLGLAGMGSGDADVADAVPDFPVNQDQIEAAFETVLL